MNESYLRAANSAHRLRSVPLRAAAARERSPREISFNHKDYITRSGFHRDAESREISLAMEEEEEEEEEEEDEEEEGEDLCVEDTSDNAYAHNRNYFLRWPGGIATGRISPASLKVGVYSVGTATSSFRSPLFRAL